MVSGKFPSREYREVKTDMFDLEDIDYFSVHEMDVMVLQLGYDETSDLPRVCSLFGSISHTFETQEKTMADVIKDVMRHLSFDITEIDAHLEVGYCDVVHFASSCHEGFSHDETLGTDDLDPPSPFDLNNPAHVNTDEGIVSDHV
ncbi:hypothetical protein Tco_1033759 [Tanacetum coccineum]